MSFHKKHVSLFALILSLVVVLAACGGSGSGNSEDGSTGSGSEGEGDTGNNDKTEEAFAVVEHEMGTTKIEEEPKKIVTLYQGATDAAIAMGVKPVGAVESWLQQPFYKYLRSDLKGTENLGSELQPNLEKISQLDPDLIIGSKVRHEKIYGKLKDIAPTVMEATVSDWKASVKLMGKSLGKEDKSQQILSDWDQSIADFKEKMGSKSADFTVSIVRFEADSARIYTQGFPNSILKEAGLQLPENQKKVKDFAIKLTSKEGIPKMNADYIFDITNDYAGNGVPLKTRKEWTNHPLWKNLDAVEKDQVRQVDAITWNMAGGPIAANKMLDDLYQIFGVEK